MFYDQNTKGFYLDGGKNRVEITDELHTELFEAQNAGIVLSGINIVTAGWGSVGYQLIAIGD